MTRTRMSKLRESQATVTCRMDIRVRRLGHATLSKLRLSSIESRSTMPGSLANVSNMNVQATGIAATMTCRMDIHVRRVGRETLSKLRLSSIESRSTMPGCLANVSDRNVQAMGIAALQSRRMCDEAMMGSDWRRRLTPRRRTSKRNKFVKKISRRGFVPTHISCIKPASLLF